MWLLFAVYGLFYGLTEGVEKALLADMASPAEKGGAFGWYNFTIGAGALPASVIFGLIWQRAGAKAAFGFGAVLACLAASLSSPWLLSGKPTRRYDKPPPVNITPFLFLYTSLLSLDQQLSPIYRRACQASFVIISCLHCI